MKQLEESTTYLIDHPTEDSQPDDLLSTFTGIEDKLDDLVSEYRRLLKRNINATDATSASANSAQFNNQNAPRLQTASSNQSALIDFSANSSAVTSTQHQQPSFSVANMSTSVENNQNLQDNQQQQATFVLQLNSFAALPFPPTNFRPQTHNNTAPISSSTITQTSRLPKIKVDKYDGDPMKWNMWYGLFQATDHSQATSDAEELTHLQTMTTGRAHQAIAGYSCNSAVMCTTALQELELRFGKPDRIVNNHINKLQQLRLP